MEAQDQTETLRFPEQQVDEIVDLVHQTWRLHKRCIEAMKAAYPEGSRVAFKRTAGQKNFSRGVVIGHNASDGAALRIRYDGRQTSVRIQLYSNRVYLR